MKRFHLASLFASALTAALLLGVSLVSRVEIDTWVEISVQSYVILRDPLDVSNNPGVVHVRVFQGWPYPIREFRGLAEGSPEYLQRAPFLREFLSIVRVDWRAVALNGVALLFATITILICVEWLVRRRISKLETGP